MLVNEAERRREGKNRREKLGYQLSHLTRKDMAYPPPSNVWIPWEQAGQLSVEEVALRMRTDLRAGLSWTEVAVRRGQVGWNEFLPKDNVSALRKYLQQFEDPLILLLLVSAFVSICLQQYDDAISIAVAVCIVVSVAFIQEYRSEKSLEELNKLVPHTCRCIREGQIQSLLARELVPGDVVVLSTGDRIPADVRLTQTTASVGTGGAALSVDESSFTGETEPCSKQVVASCQHPPPNMCYMGTLVRCGSAMGVVVSTGENSKFGEIFKMMAAEEPPKTPLQKSMTLLGKHLSLFSFTVIGAIGLLGWAQGRPILELFNVGVSLAVAAIPEGLPIVVTVTLALGVTRMAKRKAIVKRLPTVETLGCVDVVCSDKTGTLTTNEMTATTAVLCGGSENETQMSVVRLDNDYVSEEVHENLVPTTVALASLLEAGCVCNNAQLGAEGELMGQPTETALVVAAAKFGQAGARDSYVRLQEFPFSSETKMMVVRCIPKNNNGKPTKQVNGSDSPVDETYFCKGSPDSVVAQCRFFLSQNTDLSCSYLPLTKKAEEELLARSHYLGSQGLRVLALSRGTHLHQMVFLGLIGLEDPLRSHVRETVAVMRTVGVSLKILTGDMRETSCAIASQIGLDVSTAVGGEMLDMIDDAALASMAASTSVFYRVTPRHKLRIVKALQSQGLVVGMIGDGVNDGVALRKADIGIAMGQKGTDVSKEAADMILVDDDFRTIVAAMEEGKSIFHNIRNFVRFQLSTSVAALALIALSTLAGMPNPLNAMQILWVNIIMDGPPAQSLGVEPVRGDVIRQPPRNVREPMVTRALVVDVVATAVVIVVGTLALFQNEVSDNIINKRDTTMAFTCFVFFGMFNALNCRSQTESIFTLGICRNRALCASVIVCVAGQLLVVYLPLLQSVFQTEALPLTDLLLLVAISSSLTLVVELKKLLFRHLGNRNSLYPRHSPTAQDSFLADYDLV